MNRIVEIDQDVAPKSLESDMYVCYLEYSSRTTRSLHESSKVQIWFRAHL